MNKNLFFIVLLISVLFAGCEGRRGSFIHIKESNNSVESTVQKLEALIKQDGLTHFYTINHSKNAKDVKIKLRDESLVIFGNASMGSRLIRCNQTMGLDLPLKILIYEDFDGFTKISYTNPEYYTLTHNIKDKKCLAIITKASIALDVLSEKLVK